MKEYLGDYMDMLEEIEQGYDDDFKWVDQNFIESLKEQLMKKGKLSEKQMQSIRNIYARKK